MKCLLIKRDEVHNIGTDETGYGVPVTDDNVTPGYFVLFPATSGHGDIRVLLRAADIEITDSSSEGEDIFNGVDQQLA